MKIGLGVNSLIYKRGNGMVRVGLSEKRKKKNKKERKRIRCIRKLVVTEDSRNGANHVQTHFHATTRVIWPRFRKSGDAIIAVTE